MSMKQCAFYFENKGRTVNVTSCAFIHLQIEGHCKRS